MCAHLRHCCLYSVHGVCAVEPLCAPAPHTQKVTERVVASFLVWCVSNFSRPDVVFLLSTGTPSFFSLFIFSKSSRACFVLFLSLAAAFL